MSGEWAQLEQTVAHAAGTLARFARELAAPLDTGDQDQIAEQAVFLAADIALAASAALENRYPARGCP